MINKILIFFAFVFSLCTLQAEKQTYDVPERTLEAISYDVDDFQTNVLFLLSDGTCWKKNFNIHDEITLLSWEEGDTVTFYTADKAGLELFNKDKLSFMDVVPLVSSLDKFLTITRIDTKKGFFFSSYHIFLSDGSVWELMFGKLSNQWKVGQQVIYCGPFSRLINLCIQWDPTYYDERTIPVNYTPDYKN